MMGMPSFAGAIAAFASALGKAGLMYGWDFPDLPPPAPANARILVSRNKREGRYCGRFSLLADRKRHRRLGSRP